MEASDVIGEVQRYREALYAKRPVNVPAFKRLVRAHIPRGVPEEWRSVQDYILQDLKDAGKQAVADDKAPGSNRVTAALIAELPEPLQGLLVHAYRAILGCAEVPESWHEAIIWLMPNGTATGNLEAYRPIALGQQDMQMLMTPLMRRFPAVLPRKGLAADWQFGAMLGSTAAAPVFLAQHRLQRGHEEIHVLAFDVSKALDTALHGALALLLRHIGVPKELIRLFHTLSCGSFGAHRHRTWPHTEHSPPQGPAAGQCGECHALPPPLGAPLAEPRQQGPRGCPRRCGAPGTSVL